MPYQQGTRLPGERASRLGHLDVLKSELVTKLCESFEQLGEASSTAQPPWDELPEVGEPLPLVFAVDGSLQIIENELPPHRALAFVKTALLRVDRIALAQVDKNTPHPFQLRDLLADAAIYHATVFPMRHVSVPGVSLYHAVRRVIYDSVRDPRLDGEVFETLKWIVYEKWGDDKKGLQPFECPHCGSQNATLEYDEDAGVCPDCAGELLLTDMLGFHLVMADDAAPDEVATSYMAVHETLMVFTAVRYFWVQRRDVVTDCLFIKDGPLSVRAQYSKLVQPIRRFLQYARDMGYDICIVGQEKTGAFADHLALIGRHAAAPRIFVPGHDYIRTEVQHRPTTGNDYGTFTNYGAKVFLKLNERHQAVLNIPTGEYRRDPTIDDLIGVRRILGTLPTLLSSRFEGALFPVELANSVASLSTYPSAKVLELFADATIKG